MQQHQDSGLSRKVRAAEGDAGERESQHGTASVALGELFIRWCQRSANYEGGGPATALYSGGPEESARCAGEFVPRAAALGALGRVLPGHEYQRSRGPGHESAAGLPRAVQGALETRGLLAGSNGVYVASPFGGVRTLP